MHILDIDGAVLCVYDAVPQPPALLLLHGVCGAYSDRGEVLSEAVSAVGDISGGTGDDGVAWLMPFVEMTGVACLESEEGGKV